MERAENNTYLDLAEACMKDDLRNFIRLVEKGGCYMDEDIPWLTCPIGCNKPRVLMRTPLMIAAISGSEKVVECILWTGLVNVDKRSPSDGATAIECAYDASSSPAIIMMLHNARRRPLSYFDHISRNYLYEGLDRLGVNHKSALSSAPSSSSGQGHLNSNINSPNSMHQLGPGMAELVLDSSSVNYNITSQSSMSGKQEPHSLMNISNDPAIMNYDHQQQYFNLNQSMQGRQEPNILTSSNYATINNYGHTTVGVAAGERPSSSKHQVYQNMSHSMQGSQEPKGIMNKYRQEQQSDEHTQRKAAAVADDEWPSLMDDVLLEVRKLLNSTEE